MKPHSRIQKTTNSEQETLQFGFELAGLLDPGDVVCLYGDLGAGKTNLVKGIASGFGVDPNKVNSPTFTLINEYEGTTKIYHFDMYRVKSDSELVELGIEEYLYSNGICVIEWPEKLGIFLPDNALCISIMKKGRQMRYFEEVVR